MYSILRDLALGFWNLHFWILGASLAQHSACHRLLRTWRETGGQQDPTMAGPKWTHLHFRTRLGLWTEPPRRAPMKQWYLIWNWYFPEDLKKSKMKRHVLHQILQLNTFLIRPLDTLFCFSFFFFNWSINALQCCVVFCHTSTGVSHRYTYGPSLLNLPPTSHPIPTPLGSHRALDWAPCFIQQNPTGHLFYI